MNGRQLKDFLTGAGWSREWAAYWTDTPEEIWSKAYRSDKDCSPDMVEAIHSTLRSGTTGQQLRTARTELGWGVAFAVEKALERFAGLPNLTPRKWAAMEQHTVATPAQLAAWITTLAANTNRPMTGKELRRRRIEVLNDESALAKRLNISVDKWRMWERMTTPVPQEAIDLLDHLAAESSPQNPTVLPARLREIRKALGWSVPKAVRGVNAALRLQRPPTVHLWRAFESGEKHVPSVIATWAEGMYTTAKKLGVLKAQRYQIARRLRAYRTDLGWSVPETVEHLKNTLSPPPPDGVDYYNALERGAEPIPEIIMTTLKDAAKAAKTAQEQRATPAHLVRFRQAFNLSQADAARLIGITRISWNRYENEKSPIPKHMLATLRGVVQELKARQVPVVGPGSNSDTEGY